ncbi:hypothetical protein PYV02_06725 [Leifsonia sp. H3M29-4]|uniref:hypothetical protein n=1 Tax=Salinibacterium metalliresistens TaxID=3031321 RepID=UPI0023DA0B74|nr:hypothetical protein [Salinibacterium metalliresistens]MDF1478777.1 hypothetical protein [Salinibacterium metalliresistens]
MPAPTLPKALPMKVLRRLWAIGQHAVTWTRDASLAATLAAEKQAAEVQLAREWDEWNAGMLRLADALGMDAHEARQALIRESFRAAQATASDHPSDS